MAIDLNQILGILVSACTIIAYLILFTLSRKWRRNFESKGVTYWKGSKERRLKELMRDVWNPKRIITIHGLSYFAEGYIRTTMMLWVPLFLIQVKQVNILETALFVGLMNVA